MDLLAAVLLVARAATLPILLGFFAIAVVALVRAARDYSRLRRKEARLGRLLARQIDQR